MSIASAQSLINDERVEGIAIIQATSGPCSFDVNTDRLTEYLRQQDLLSPEALSALQANAGIQRLILDQAQDQLPIICAQAEATADAIGILEAR